MHHCPTVSDHKDKFGIWKEVLQIDGRTQGKGVFVAQSRGRLTVPDDYLENKGADGRVEHFGGNACLFETFRLERCFHPGHSVAEKSRYYSCLLAASNLRVSIKQNSQQCCSCFVQR